MTKEESEAEVIISGVKLIIDGYLSENWSLVKDGVESITGKAIPKRKERSKLDMIRDAFTEDGDPPETFSKGSVSYVTAEPNEEEKANNERIASENPKTYRAPNSTKIKPVNTKDIRII